MAPLFASRTTSAPSSAAHGSVLTFETVVADEAAPLRLRPEQDTLVRVIAGMVRVVVEGDDRVLAEGEEAIVPAGVVHRFESAYGAARFMTGFRPAG